MSMRNHQGRINNSVRDCRLCGEGNEESIHLATECTKTRSYWLTPEWTTEELKKLITEDPVRIILSKRPE